jgi:hypothetical protein
VHIRRDLRLPPGKLISPPPIPVRAPITTRFIRHNWRSWFSPIRGVQPERWDWSHAVGGGIETAVTPTPQATIPYEMLTQELTGARHSIQSNQPKGKTADPFFPGRLGFETNTTMRFETEPFKPVKQDSLTHTYYMSVDTICTWTGANESHFPWQSGVHHDIRIEGCTILRHFGTKIEHWDEVLNDSTTEALNAFRRHYRMTTRVLAHVSRGAEIGSMAVNYFLRAWNTINPDVDPRFWPNVVQTAMMLVGAEDLHGLPSVSSNQSFGLRPQWLGQPAPHLVYEIPHIPPGLNRFDRRNGDTSDLILPEWHNRTQVAT